MLDKKALQILYELDKNASTSLSKLAKKIRISKQNLNYRIKSLEKEKVILKYTTIIDLHKLGLLTYRLYIRYNKADEKTEAKIIDYFKKRKEVVWMASLSGSWDLEVTFGAKNFIQLSNIIKESKVKIGKYFSKINISMSIVNYHFNRDYLVNKKRESFSNKYYGFEPKETELDELDKKILREISEDCRQNSSQVGEKIGVTYHTVKKRIKALEERGIIQGYRPLIDFNKTGREYFKANISLRNTSKDDEKQIYSLLGRNNFIVYLIEVLGERDLEIEAEVENLEELTKVIKELRNKFPEKIEDYEILKITKEHKLNYLPF